MSAQGFLPQAVVYLAAALVAVPVAKRLGFGSVLGYLVAGVIIGPFGLRLVGAEGQDVLHFAEFGVVMMLFVVGLELQPSLLWRLRKPVLGMGGLQVAATALAVSASAMAFGLEARSALAVGLILAMSSTAIVLQTLEEKALLKTDAGQSSFAVLLFQDLAVIPILALLPLLAPRAAGAASEAGVARETGSTAATWIAGLPGWAQGLANLGAVALIVGAGLFLVRPALRFVGRTALREMFTAAALLLVIGTATLMSGVGLSPALGTFLAGVVLANSEFRHELETDIEPFKGLLLGLFFIAVGSAIDFKLVAASPGAIALLVASLLAVKFAVLAVVAKAFGLARDQGLLFAFALAQGGEFAFVLFAYARDHRVLPGQVAEPLVAVVALSMAATPLLLLLADRVVLRRLAVPSAPAREPDAVRESNPVLIAGFGRFGHIVGRFVAANGISATVLDEDLDQVELLRRLGMKVHYGDASRVDLLRAAGAAKARLLVVAVDDPGRALEIVHAAKNHFPNLAILARARGRQHAYELLDAGVEHVYRETLDSSLRLGIDALRLLGVRGHRAVRAARTFRAHDEESVRELAALRHDEKVYFRRARERIRDLERLIQSDREEIASTRDAAWDSEPLRQDFGKK
jgi:monovalent cation:proton antiporter-2 (CPA2) family protein